MSDKVAIVTGGGQGIGAGIAERLAHDGYAVIVNGRTKSKLDSVVAHITAQGGQAVSFVGDVQSRQVNIDMVQFAMTTYGRLDVFVANAGIDWVDSIEETPEAEVDNVLNINLKSQIWALQAAPSAMRKNGSAGDVSNLGGVVILFWHLLLQVWRALSCLVCILPQNLRHEDWCKLLQKNWQLTISV